MYSIHNEGSWLIAERFIKILKTKIYKKITDNDSKSYLPYLNKLIDQCNNTYHHYTINADYSTFTEKIETNYKAPEFKVGDWVRITKYKSIFSKGYTEKLVKRNIYYWFCLEN